MFTGTSSAAPYVKDGRLVALAVSSAARQPAYPTTPSIAGAEFPKFDFVNCYGIVAPNGAPRDIVQRLSREVAAALQQPDVRERFASLGVEPAPSSPEQFTELWRKQTASLADLVRVTGVKAE